MKSLQTLSKLATLWLLALVTAGEVPAKADNYPTHPVRFVTGYGAGGTGDILARVMGQWLSERLGQPVIIENKPRRRLESRHSIGDQFAA